VVDRSTRTPDGPWKGIADWTASAVTIGRNGLTRQASGPPGQVSQAYCC
jgi:hypothetical protein